MCEGKNNDKKGKSFANGCCDGTAELMRGCFPDDAGYSACLAMMKENREKFCGQKTDDEAKKKNQGCCG